MQVNMLDAKNQLSKLVKAAERGANVVIARDGRPVVRLVPCHSGTGIKGWGSLKGYKKVDEAFSVATDAQVTKLLLGD
jgi:prevent-host-death family protein